MAGYIDEVSFAEGKEVKKGDLLFVIDPRPYRAELERLQAEVERAQTASELAQADVVRGDKLLKTRAMSQEEYEQRVSQGRASAAQVRAAKAAIEVARLNVGYTRVTSPIDGRVGRAEVTRGNLVSGGQGGSATRLTTVVSLDPMYAYFDAAERDYLKYVNLARPRRAAELARREQPGAHGARRTVPSSSTRATWTSSTNRIEPSTGTITGRAVFSNSDRFLTPGMFVRIRLVGSGQYKGVLINDKAVATDQDRRYVLVVGKNDMVEYRAVTLGPIVDGLRVVRSGLKAGERIVVNGLQRVRPGVQVKPKIVPMDSAPA